MKGFNLICALLILPFCLSAQTSGLIKYTTTQKLDRQLPPNVPENVRRNFPTERKLNKELYFSPTESLYKNGERIIPEDTGIDGDERGRRFRNRMNNNRANEHTYVNTETALSIKQREILGKTFLIEENNEKLTWKMTGQKKQILDYLCMEATTMMNDSISITAWFTPQIPISIGPEDFRGLPGAILEVSTNENKKNIIATSVELTTIDSNIIKPPTKGKKVTQEEFEKIRIEKMKELRAQRGGRGGRTNRG